MTCSIPEGKRIVTYATRGMESMRGFDIFMKAAKRLCDRRNDVLFVVAGQDRVCYGGDEHFTGGKTFKEWVLRRTTTTCRGSSSWAVPAARPGPAVLT